MQLPEEEINSKNDQREGASGEIVLKKIIYLVNK